MDVYRELVAERDCTPEEQAGREARTCPKCDRETVHQAVRLCMACGYDPAKASLPGHQDVIVDPPLKSRMLDEVETTLCGMLEDWKDAGATTEVLLEALEAWFDQRLQQHLEDRVP